MHRRELILPDRRLHLPSRRSFITGGLATLAAIALRPNPAFATDFNIFAAPFNCPTNGTSDCSTAINAAISAAASGTNLRNRVVCTPTTGTSVKLTCNSSITYDPFHVQLDLGGSQLFFPNTGTGLIINSTIGGNTFGLPAALRGGFINGANAFIGTSQSAITLAGQNILLEDLQIAGSGIGVNASGTNVYLLSLNNVFINNCSFGFSQIGNPSNAGEMISIIGGAIGTCTVGVDFQNTNGGLFMRSLSIDACSCAIRTQGGPVRGKDIHIETNFDGTGSGFWQLMCLGNNIFSEIILEDCELVYASASGAPSLVNCTAPLPFGVQLIRPRWGGNWTGTVNNISNGAGGAVSVRKGASTNQSQTVYPPLIDLNNTWNTDPNFTQATFADLWALTKDTIANDGPTQGTNGSIAMGTTNPHTGTHAIAAAKTGVATTAFGFGVFIPASAFDNLGTGVWYRANANGLGTTAMNLKWVALQGSEQSVPGRGTPFICNQIISGTVTLTPSITYQQAVFAPRNSPAPTWATHALVEFDMASMAAGTLYIGAPFEVYQL